jgi:hypothetical protein
MTCRPWLFVEMNAKNEYDLHNGGGVDDGHQIQSGAKKNESEKQEDKTVSIKWYSIHTYVMRNL